MKKFVTIACIVLLVAFMLAEPEVAADAVSSIWGALVGASGAVTAFLKRLFS